MFRRRARWPVVAGWHRCGLAVAAVTAAAAMSACAGPPSATSADVARTVDIGGGRGVFLQCRGSGSPTVVLVSGTGGAADEWTDTADPADPAAPLRPSSSAVLPSVASFTRVCAYDRPGTTTADGRPGASTAVPQPTTARAGVDDLRAVLAAAGEPGPYVLVGASWGAMIVALFGRSAPDEVAGLVTVDGASVFLRDTMTAGQWSDWMRTIAAADPTARLERPDYDASVAQILAVPPMPRRPPAVVLTSDEPWDLQVGGEGSTWPAWLAAQDRLAADLAARHVGDTHSGHGIAVEQPRLVTDAVREVVDASRAAAATPR